VSDWANFKGGVEKASSNPKYCYEWAFVDSKHVVLNIWYGSIIETAKHISLTENLRETSRSESTKAIWKKRADKFDKAVRDAFLNSKTVRVIINEGLQRDGHSKQTKASNVKFRLLDTEPWTITSYDDKSGQFVLKRGLQQPKIVDQFDVENNGKDKPQKRSVTGSVFTRSQEVRNKVLDRSEGKCEYCGEAGFKTIKNEIYLETHHIIPLSEDGPDNIKNVAALCPNHHREAHHGFNAKRIRMTLIKKVTESSSNSRT
jgi:5-methylcytosine-specific restriction protein A